MAKILVIDDSLFQRGRIREILKKIDEYEIQEAADGRQGLEMITTFAPDCIVLDILMPNMDGLSFLRTLQKQEENTPVIVLTADIQETTRQECLKLGAKGVVHKPLLPSEADKLRAIINNILDSEEEAMS